MKILVIGNREDQLKDFKQSLTQKNHQVIAIRENEKIPDEWTPDRVIICGEMNRNFAPLDVAAAIAHRFGSVRIMSNADCPNLKRHHHGLAIEYFYSKGRLMKAIDAVRKPGVNLFASSG